MNIEPKAVEPGALPAGGAGLGSFTAEAEVATPAEFLFTPGGTGGAWLRRSPILGEELVLAEVDTGAPPGVWTDREMTAPMRSW